MPKLGVEICGVKFKNPVIAASGTFGFGREFDALYDISVLGGISVKGLTLQKRLGNPPPRIAETKSGILNSVGLQNPGVDAFINEDLPWLKQKDLVVIANIAGSTVEDYVKMAEKLAPTAVDMLEMNISCPNVKEGGVAFGVKPEKIFEVTKAVCGAARQPVIVKLSPNAADIAENARAAEEAGAQALSLINTLTGMVVDVYRKRPVLFNNFGGMSGAAVRPIALRMVYQAAHAVKIPVIGMGGITSGEDAAAFMLCGARAVMVGTQNFSDPMAMPKIVSELHRYLEKTGVVDVNDIVDALVMN